MGKSDRDWKAKVEKLKAKDARLKSRLEAAPAAPVNAWFLMGASACEPGDAVAASMLRSLDAVVMGMFGPRGMRACGLAPDGAGTVVIIAWGGAGRLCGRPAPSMRVAAFDWAAQAQLAPR